MNLSSEKVKRRTDDVLRFVTEYIDENGFAPSYQEITDGTDLCSKATVNSYIMRLEQLGYIISKSGARKLVVTKEGWEKVGKPR